MLAKAVTRKIVDTLGRQTAQVEVTKGELIDDMERMQDYGFTSNPPVAGTDAIVAFLGGSREQGVIIRMENRQFRLKALEAGEVAMFDDLGNVFKMGRDAVDLVAVTKAAISGPEVEVLATASATIGVGGSSIVVTPGAINITSTVLTHNGKNIGNTHYHVGSPPTAVPV
jgi:phage baseplate assembly protein V